MNQTSSINDSDENENLTSLLNILCDNEDLQFTNEEATRTTTEENEVV